MLFLAMYIFVIVTMRLCVQRNTSPTISKCLLAGKEVPYLRDRGALHRTVATPHVQQ